MLRVCPDEFEGINSANQSRYVRRIEIATATCCGLAMTIGEIPGFKSKRLRMKNHLPENLVAPPDCNKGICAWRFWGIPIQSAHVLFSKVYFYDFDSKQLLKRKI